MSNIVDDIVNEVQIKPKRYKSVLKWVISLAIAGITIAFGLGEFKAKFSHRIDTIEILSDTNKREIIKLRGDMNNNINGLRKETNDKIEHLDERVDNLYNNLK